MNRNTKRILIYVAFGAFSLLCLGLVIYGVYQHEEPQFIAGVPTWKRAELPLTVRAEQYTAEGRIQPTSNQRGALDDVIKTINTRLGFEALRMAGASEGAKIHILHGVPYDESWEDPGANAQFQATPEGLAKMCHVQTSNIAPNMVWLVLYHEFGHCFGLAHDDYTLSIMYPKLAPTPEGELPPWFSDADRDALREMYAPR